MKGHNRIVKKYIKYTEPDIYGIYYRDNNVLYINKNFSGSIRNILFMPMKKDHEAYMKWQTAVVNRELRALLGLDSKVK